MSRKPPQDIARKQRDLKLGTLESDIDDALTRLAASDKKVDNLSDAVRAPPRSIYRSVTAA